MPAVRAMLEKIKTGVIILLLAAMIPLITLSITMGVQEGTGVVGYITGLFSGPRLEVPVYEALPVAAALPAEIALVGENGVCAAWSADEYDAVRLAVQGVYDEAFGSSSAMTPIDRDTFMSMLSYPAIYMSFDSYLPAFLHRAWAGADYLGHEQPLKSAVIALVGNKVKLAFYDGDGMYWVFETNASPVRLKEACDQAFTVNAFFAVDDDRFSRIECDQLVYPASDALPLYSVETVDYASAGEVPASVLEAFTLRPFFARFYVSGSGSVEYIEGDSSLCALPDGSLSLSSTEKPVPADEVYLPGSNEYSVLVCEYVRSIVNNVWTAAAAGPGKLSLDYFSYDAASDSYYLGFELLVGGRKIGLDRRPALAVIQNGVVRSITVRPHALQALDDVLEMHYMQYASVGTGRVGIYYTVGNGVAAPVVGFLTGGK